MPTEPLFDTSIPCAPSLIDDDVRIPSYYQSARTMGFRDGLLADAAVVGALDAVAAAVAAHAAELARDDPAEAYAGESTARQQAWMVLSVNLRRRFGKAWDEGRAEVAAEIRAALGQDRGGAA